MRGMLRIFKFKGERGFTIPELMESVLILSIIAGAAAMLLNTGLNTYKLDEQRLDAQRIARIGSMRMSQEIKDSYQITSVSSYALSLSGIAVNRETLTTTDNLTYRSSHSHWLTSASATIYVNGEINTSGTINYTSGTVTFSTAETRIVQADYTYDARTTYSLGTDGVLTRVEYPAPYYTALATETVARSVVNRQVSPAEPLFTRDATAAPYLINVDFVVDRNLNDTPGPYRLSLRVRARK